MRKLRGKKYLEYDLKRGVDFIGVTCVFFCHDGKGNVLLHKRSNKCRDEVGRWDCGAGAMEFGEEFEEAVKREIKEEYGIEPLALHFAGASNILRKNGAVGTHWIALIFAARIEPEKVKIGEPEKVDEHGWFPLNKLPDPLHSALPKHLNMVKTIIEV